MARGAAILGVLFLCGCAQGLVYTHVTRPLTTNFHRTPVAGGFNGKGDVKELRYNAFLRVLWDENSIGSVAKQAGFTQIYYADLETFSVLGVWTQYRVHVYGSKAVGEDAAP